MSNMRDERGVVGAWLVKIVIGIGVVALVLFDAVTVAVNFVGLDSTADDAAIALSRLVTSAPDASSPVLRCTPHAPSGSPVCEEAEKIAADAAARLLLVEVDRNEIVHVKLRRVARTLLVRRVSAIRSWGVATAEGQAGST